METGWNGLAWKVWRTMRSQAFGWSALAADRTAYPTPMSSSCWKSQKSQRFLQELHGCTVHETSVASSRTRWLHMISRPINTLIWKAWLRDMKVSLLSKTLLWIDVAKVCRIRTIGNIASNRNVYCIRSSVDPSGRKRLLHVFPMCTTPRPANCL